jgi:phage shock protein C
VTCRAPMSASAYETFFLLFSYFRLESRWIISGGVAMTCPNCQKEIVDGSKFCYNCGHRLAADSAAPGHGASRAYAPPRRLVRSSNNQKIAGVCAGVADYFEIDTSLVRALWVLATLVPGPNIIAYIILWIVLPLGPTGEPSNMPRTAASV